jgi:anti-sigma B factor antagonist
MTLGVLLGGMKRLGTAGGRLELVVSRPDIHRIFEITMLDRVFELHETREQALEACLDGDAP